MGLNFYASSRVQLEVVDKEAILFYRLGREDMVLRVHYRLNEQGAGKARPQPNAAAASQGAAIAWVVPVPTLPVGYAQVDQKIFEEMGDLLHPPTIIPRETAGSFGGGANGATPAPAVHVYPAVTKGDYTIQPVQGEGAEGVRGLAAWFKQNNFEPLPERALDYYARQGWTFLAVRLKVADAALHGSGTLPALRVSFNSERIWFPLKLARSERMSARIFLVLDYKIANPAQALQAFGFELQAMRPLPRSAVTRDTLALWNTTSMGSATVAYLYEYKANRVQPSQWPTDVFLPGLPRIVGF